MIPFKIVPLIFIILLLRLLVSVCFWEKREREREVFYLTRV